MVVLETSAKLLFIVFILNDVDPGALDYFYKLLQSLNPGVAPHMGSGWAYIEGSPP